MDFEQRFKVYNLVSIRPESMKLGQQLILTRSFIWWGQFIDWLQFETRPSSSLNFGMAYNATILFLEASQPCCITVFTDIFLLSISRS